VYAARPLIDLQRVSLRSSECVVANGSSHCPFVVREKRGFRQVRLAGLALQVNLVKTRLLHAVRAISRNPLVSRFCSEALVQVELCKQQVSE
jgi:hypothetical protein